MDILEAVESIGMSSVFCISLLIFLQKLQILLNRVYLRSKLFESVLNLCKFLIDERWTIGFVTPW